MCFSATASFAGGASLAALGVVTLKHTKSSAEVPVASIPLIFGIQQAIEGVVWASFGAPVLNQAAAYAFTFFSHIFWPLFVPLALMRIETDAFRKRILAGCAVAGTTAAAYLAYHVTTEPVTAEIVRHSIAYNSAEPYPLAVVPLYLMATCGSALASSHRTMNLFGFLLFISYAIALWFYRMTFFSVWCFFAAVLSIVIFYYFWKRPADTVPRPRTAA